MKNFFQIEKSNLLKSIPILSSLIIILWFTTISPPMGYAFNFPLIPLICVIGWTLIIKSNLSMLSIFFLGLFTDLSMGTTLGYHSLLFNLSYLLARVIYVRFDLSYFYKNYIAAIIIIIIYFLINFIYFLFYHNILLSLEVNFFKFLITIAIYPSFYIFFLWIYRILKLDKVYAT